MMPGPVRPRVLALTDEDTRELLAPSLKSLCSDHGPTRVGQNIGIGEKAVRDGRDEKSLIGTTAAFNLLLLDPTALNELAAHFGMVLVPIDGEPDEDDAAYAEMIDGALEVVTEGMKNGRLGRLCHRGKAAVLKAVDKLAAARARVKRGRA